MKDNLKIILLIVAFFGYLITVAIMMGNQPSEYEEKVCFRKDNTGNFIEDELYTNNKCERFH